MTGPYSWWPGQGRQRHGEPVLLLIDMDSCLFDWTSAVWQLVADLCQAEGVPFPLGPKDAQPTFQIEHGITDPHALDIIQRAKWTPGLYENLQPYDGAVEAIAALQEHVPVMLCTTPDAGHATCASEKLASAARHFGRKVARDAAIVRDKTAMRGTALVDDKDRITGLFTPSWLHVYRTQPWNAHLPGPRLDTWHDWPHLLPLLGIRQAA